MRTAEEVKDLILHVANADDRVRAVLLTGSRADPNSPKDIFQDFDIIYIVVQFQTFLKDNNWIDVFGERIIQQLPDEMTMGNKDGHSYHYLMLFTDGNRIDLTIFPEEKLKTEFKKDSLATLLLDKDTLFEKLPTPRDTDYLIRRPAEKEFKDCCNEFWWVSTYVAKALWRKEVTYAKELLEIPVRNMFLRIIEWYMGTTTGFSTCFGKGGRHMKKHISPDMYKRILLTYQDGSIENIWNSLFLITNLFDDLANKIAISMGFTYNRGEADNVAHYLKRIYELPDET